MTPSLEIEPGPRWCSPYNIYNLFYSHTQLQAMHDCIILFTILTPYQQFMALNRASIMSAADWRSLCM